MFEGLDGSGLSTQAEMLKKYLTGIGKTVVPTKEQTDGLIGGLIKSNLRHEWKTNPLALQMLFAADRAHHIESQIKPALEQGKIVISDRYVMSSLAFGSMEADIEFLKIINSRFIKPDVTFIIDTPPKICLQRVMETRFHAELFEEEDKFNQVRENYMKVKPYYPNTFVIDGDGNRTKEEVFEDIKKIIDKML